MLIGADVWYQIELSFLDDLGVLLGETQNIWDKALENIQKEHDSLTEEDEKEAYIDHNYDFIFQMRDVLPRVTRNSILINAFAFLEFNINSFYDEVQGLLPSNDNNRYLRDRINYLNDVFG